ncbi:hypothetical protein Aduo_005669 [Ancylostoma duodenale]
MCSSQALQTLYQLPSKWGKVPKKPQAFCSPSHCAKTTFPLRVLCELARRFRVRSERRHDYAQQPVSFLLLWVFSQTLSPPITSKFKCLTNGCCDEHEWCRFWASIGECQANQEWMAGNCQLACGTCNAPMVTAGEFFSTVMQNFAFYASTSHIYNLK